MHSSTFLLGLALAPLALGVPVAVDTLSHSQDGSPGKNSDKNLHPVTGYVALPGIDAHSKYEKDSDESGGNGLTGLGTLKKKNTRSDDQKREASPQDQDEADYGVYGSDSPDTDDEDYDSLAPTLDDDSSLVDDCPMSTSVDDSLLSSPVDESVASTVVDSSAASPTLDDPLASPKTDDIDAATYVAEPPTTFLIVDSETSTADDTLVTITIDPDNPLGSLETVAMGKRQDDATPTTTDDSIASLTTDDVLATTLVTESTPVTVEDSQANTLVDSDAAAPTMDGAPASTLDDSTTSADDSLATTLVDDSAPSLTVDEPVIITLTETVTSADDSIATTLTDTSAPSSTADDAVTITVVDEPAAPTSASTSAASEQQEAAPSSIAQENTDVTDDDSLESYGSYTNYPESYSSYSVYKRDALPNLESQAYKGLSYSHSRRDDGAAEAGYGAAYASYGSYKRHPLKAKEKRLERTERFIIRDPAQLTREPNHKDDKASGLSKIYVPSNIDKRTTGTEKRVLDKIEREESGNAGAV